MSIWQIGPNVQAEGYVAGMTSFLIEIRGTGDMYEDTSQFINITDTTTWFSLVSLCESNVIIPDGVTSIASNFWYTNDYEQTTPYLYIGKDVQRIGENAFQNISGKGIQTLEVGKPSALKSIGARAFRGCALIKEMDFQGTVTEIGEACFQGCSNLEIVNLSTELGIIPDLAFGDCYKLKRFNKRNCMQGWQGINTFNNCVCLDYLEVADDFEIYPNAFDYSLFVPKGTGDKYDEDGCLVTRIKTKSVALITYPYKTQWNRSFIFVQGTEFLYIAHKGRWIKISGYNEGDMPVSHENVYMWIRLVEQGSLSGSPVFIKHNNKWLQLEES